MIKTCALKKSILSDIDAHRAGPQKHRARVPWSVETYRCALADLDRGRGTQTMRVIDRALQALRRADMITYAKGEGWVRGPLCVSDGSHDWLSACSMHLVLCRRCGARRRTT